MMPLIVKDYSWTQTSSSVSIQVQIPGLSKAGAKTDVLTSNNYVRVHCHPYIFEAFLFSSVDDERGTCTFDKERNQVVLNFPKIQGEEEPDETSWPSLESPGLDRLKKKELRDAAVTTAHKRAEKETEARKTKREQLRKTTVEEQIRLDEEQREKVAQTKKKEKEKALAGIMEDHEWVKGETMTRVVDEVKKQDYKITSGPGGKATAQRAAAKGKRVKSGSGTTLEDIIARGPKPNTMLDPKEEGIVPETKQIWTKNETSSSIPPIRDPQRIKVHFTPREFPTPARESYAQMEEEWLKKQVEARRISGFNEPDLRPEEKNPDWLLEKGRSLMQKDSYLGAISAFSLGIKLAPKIPELYKERATAHLYLRNFIRAVDDSSAALELYTPKVPSNAGDRISCHKIRGDAFRELEMYKESIQDFKAVLTLCPDNLELKSKLEKVEKLKEEEDAKEDEEESELD